MPAEIIISGNQHSAKADQSQYRRKKYFLLDAFNSSGVKPGFFFVIFGGIHSVTNRLNNIQRPGEKVADERQCYGNVITRERIY